MYNIAVITSLDVLIVLVEIMQRSIGTRVHEALCIRRTRAIGVPIVTGLPRLYQLCTNRQKQSTTVKRQSKQQK